MKVLRCILRLQQEEDKLSVIIFHLNHKLTTAQDGQELHVHYYNSILCPAEKSVDREDKDSGPKKFALSLFFAKDFFFLLSLKLFHGRNK